MFANNPWRIDTHTHKHTLMCNYEEEEVVRGMNKMGHIEMGAVSLLQVRTCCLFKMHSYHPLLIDSKLHNQ